MDRRNLDFTSLRDDWYRSNQLVPRVVRKVLAGAASLCFVDFPRQWIPFFEYFGLDWRESSDPREHVPIFSELGEREIRRLCAGARANGTLRTLVESAAVFDPILADLLYIVDNTIDTPLQDSPCQESVRLTNWQSYGRPDVKALMDKVDDIASSKPHALVLPCARKRPYDRSRTHMRIRNKLNELGIDVSDSHRIVITSLGVIPQELWDHPTVIRYDAGVPDVYRTLRLARKFFGRNRYHKVIDCLEFPPYSDVLRIIANEGVISCLERLELRRTRQFWVKHS